VGHYEGLIKLPKLAGRFNPYEIQLRQMSHSELHNR